MNRWSLVFGALAFGLVVSSPAQASFKVIKWTSGYCQIWNSAAPTKPWPNDWRVMSKNYKAFGGAFAKREQLIKAKKCGWG